MTASTVVLIILGLATVLTWGVAVRDVVRDVRERRW